MSDSDLDKPLYVWTGRVVLDTFIETHGREPTREEFRELIQGFLRIATSYTPQIELRLQQLVDSM